MAIRQDELRPLRREAEVLRFPTAVARARAASARRAEFRRRRLAVGAFLLLVVFGSLLIGGVGVSAPGSTAGSPRAVVLQEGQTVWDIAARYAPEGSDPRAYVDQILQLNELSGAPQVGAKLKLPR